MSKPENLRLNILTPTGSGFDQDINKIAFRCTDGDIVLFKNYAPTVGTVKFGKIKIIDIENKEHFFLIDDGMYCINNNLLEIVTGFFVPFNQENIDQLQHDKEKDYDMLTHLPNHDYFDVDREIYLIKKIKSIK